MAHLIQDDIIRRALDFFGLRGVVQHGYEPIVSPVVVIGDLGQPTRMILSTNTSINDPWGAVPKNKCWRPIYASGTITQAAGAVARTYAIGWQHNGVLAGLFPFFRSQDTGADTVGENIHRTMTLNSTDNWVVRFPQNLLIPAGAIISLFAIAGDGTTSITLGARLMVQELGENLIVQG
ncbi:MAG: hypothetical protein ACRCZI_03770 [Cetobacterium sp.]